VVCNSGVGLDPVVDGRVLHFGARGLYNGLVLLGDRETGSYWDHVTGQCLHGPLAGCQMAVWPLLQTSAARALVHQPAARLAVAEQKLWQRAMTAVAQRARTSRRGVLPPFFQGTMGEEDARRPRMELGLGIWTPQTRRFYPLERLRAARGALIDELEERSLVVYLDPETKVPAALYTDASRCSWVGQALYLNTAKMVRGGLLFDEKGTRLAMEQPMQLFTRWYGFSFTFPGCEVHGG